MSVPGWGSDVSFARDYHTLITSAGEGEDRAYLNDSNGNDIVRDPGFQAKSASRSPIGGTAPAIRLIAKMVRNSTQGSVGSASPCAVASYKLVDSGENAPAAAFRGAVVLVATTYSGGPRRCSRQSHFVSRWIRKRPPCPWFRGVRGVGGYLE